MSEPDPSVVAPRSRTLGWIIVAAFAVGGSVALVAAAPSLVRKPLEASTLATMRCLSEQREQGEGEPRTCVQEDGWTKLAGVLPQADARAFAEEKALQVDRQVADTALRFAAVRDLDPGARDAAARELLNLPGKDMTKLYDVRLASELGAWEVTLDAADPSLGDSLAFAATIDAAFMLGQPERAVPFARAHAMAPEQHDFSRVRAAALLCWLGERDAAKDALEAIRDHARDQGKPDRHEVGEIELYCGLPRSDDLRLDSSFESSRLERQVHLRTTAEPLTENQATFVSPHGLAMHVARQAQRHLDPMPSWSFETIDRDAEILISTAVRLEPATGRNAQPDDGAGTGADPKEMLRGAEVLLQLADAAPEHRVFDVGVASWPLPTYTEVERPRDALRWAAFCLATFAAEEFRWRAAVSQTHEAVQVARAALEHGGEQYIEEGTALYLLPALASSMPDEALALLREFTPGSTPAQRVSLWGTRSSLAALALQTARHHGDEALAEQWVGHAADGLQAQVNEPGDWAYAAARVHGPLAGPPQTGPAPSGLLSDSIGNPAAVLAFWWRAAAADPITRDAMRWRSAGRAWVSATGPDGAVAVLEVLARAVPRESWASWLPMVSGSLGLDPLRRIRALRRAFEVLGEDELAASWAQREAAIVSRIGDRDAAALYRLTF